MLAESMRRISGLLQAGRFEGPPPALLKTLDLE
jgi:hypothetical protein